MGMMRMLMRMLVLVIMFVVVRMAVLLVRMRMGVRRRKAMVMIMVMRMVLMRMPAASMVMVVSMMMVAKGSHANKIDRQAKTAHDEELGQPLGLPALDDPFKCLDHDLHADKHQEDAIRKPAQRLDLAEAVREA
jgi:hypothetical protein